MLAALWGCTVMLPSYFIWEKQWRFGLMKSQRIIKVGRIHRSHGNHECLHQISQRSSRHLLEIFQSWPKWWATWLDSAIPRVMNVFLLFYCNIFYCWSSKGASWGTEGAVNTTNICGLLFLTIDVYLTVTRTSGSLVHAVHKAPFTNKFRALCLYLCQCLAAHRHA